MPAGEEHGDVTLVEVLDELSAQGYTGSFLVEDDGSVRCRACASVHAPTVLHLHQLRRLEGTSDPADEVAVLAVACPACDVRGAIVARYGPEAGRGDTALLLAIEDHRREQVEPG